MMSANTMGKFMDYFDSFEAALQTGNWDKVGDCLSENAQYSVEGVPFACNIEGREEIVRAFQKSTTSFDATMDYRLLEIQSIVRLESGRIRVELISGYGREATGSITAPVTIEVKADEEGITELRDIYDPELTTPALTWIAINFGDADPSYV